MWAGETGAERVHLAEDVDSGEGKVGGKGRPGRVRRCLLLAVDCKVWTVVEVACYDPMGSTWRSWEGEVGEEGAPVADVDRGVEVGDLEGDGFGE